MKNSVHRRPRSFFSLATLVTISSSTLLMACGCQYFVRKDQSPELEAAISSSDDETKYIGDVCRIWGLNYAKVDGIGLAVNLDGTGSNPTESGQREQLKKDLLARGVHEATELISGDDTSMVIVRGFLPPAIRKGERFDVEVRLMRNSETTNLERGFVLKTGLRPVAKLGKRMRQGAVTGFVEGNILVDGLFESRDDQPNQMSGWILGGGIATEDRPIGLTIRSESTSIRTATSIARAINSRFTTVDKSGRRGVANPKTDRLIELEIPEDYRQNIGRYLHVILNIAYDETPQEKVDRLEQLERDMGQPMASKEASIRLEALGKEAIPALKRSLQHQDHNVQFYAAQSLAYFGDENGVNVLSSAASNSAFRWNALAALAVIDHLDARQALKSLMHEDSNETRYGAFRSLAVQSPNDPLVRGERLANSFYFHEVPSETQQPMMHFSRSKRPEIVLFGEEQSIADGFVYVQKGLTVKSLRGGVVQVSRFTEDGKSQLTCSNKIADLITAMAKLGVDYSSQLRLFRLANNGGYLNSRLVINAVPRLRTERQEQEVLVAQNSEMLPEMFRVHEEDKSETRRVETGMLTSEKEKKPSVFSKIRGFWGAE